MLTHFDEAFADRLHIAQVAERSLAEPRDQPTLCRLVAQTFQPSIELGQGLDDVHATSVIDRLHYCKTGAGRAVAWSGAAKHRGLRKALLASQVRFEREMGIEPT